MGSGLMITVDKFSSITLWLGFLTISVSHFSNHPIYFSKQLNDSKYGPKSITLITLDIVQLTLKLFKGFKQKKLI